MGFPRGNRNCTYLYLLYRPHDDRPASLRRWLTSNAKPKYDRMKYSQNPDTAGHCTTEAQYAMRAECLYDCFQIRAALGYWITMWRDDSTTAGVDIVFSLC